MSIGGVVTDFTEVRFVISDRYAKFPNHCFSCVFGQCVTKGFLRRSWYGGVNHRLEDIQDLMVCVDVCIFPQVIAALLKRLLTLHRAC